MYRVGSWIMLVAVMAGALLSGGMLASCRKAPVEQAPAAVPTPMPAPVAAPMRPGMSSMPGMSGMSGMGSMGGMGPGHTLFKIYCARCHTMMGDMVAAAAPPPDGQPATAKAANKGPDLMRIGADPEHTHAWLVEHIRDPKSHNPDSTMPKFAGRLKDKEIDVIAKFLAGMR